MKKFKPGEKFNKFQEQKKKHEKKMKSYSESDMGSMKNYDPNMGLPKSQVRTSGSKPIAVKPMVVKTMKKMKHKKEHSAESIKGLREFVNEEAKEKGKKAKKHKKSFNTTTKKTGKFEGKSNALGHGGRAAQLAAKGVPGGVIGAMARAAHAAPGQANYHGKKHEKHCKTCGK